MKRFLIFFLLISLILLTCACNNSGDTSPTTSPSTAPGTTVPSSANPYTKYDDMVSAYNAYISTVDSKYPITNIIFKDDAGCYIVTENQKVYNFFHEGATEASQVFESVKFTLHYAPSLADVMVLAMESAWTAYTDQCAANRTPVYDRQLYLFECGYFYGVFGIDENNQIQQNLVREGINCGTFGAFTIYVPENADQSQQGDMTDGEIQVLIANVYNKFAVQMGLDGNECQPMAYYIFEKDGIYYRSGETLERLDAIFVSELAMDISFDGWRVYLPTEADTVPDYAVLESAYNAFVTKATADKVKYKAITQYLFYDGTEYYAVDEWNNITIEDASRAGKIADKQEFEGYFIYKQK